MADNDSGGGDAPAIVWFRDDLRMSDQPALRVAADSGAKVICIYIFDEDSEGIRPLGGASRWWLHHSLEALSQAIDDAGGKLHILRGKAGELVPAIAGAAAAAQVLWTRRYGAAEIAADKAIKAELKERGVEAKSYNGQLLFEPWEIRTGSDDYYKVFSPFWRACLKQPEPVEPLSAVTKLDVRRWPSGAPERCTLSDLGLLPTAPDWAGGLRARWTPGEQGAHDRLKHFLDEAIGIYKAKRDMPAEHATSYLSPHLRFGEISPRQVWHAVTQAREAGDVGGANADKFLAEIGWREFSYNLLFHNPDLATENYNSDFDAFPWQKPDESKLEAWRFGNTGYPIVDAGMRELWQTGYMHNRVRMIVASFLIKHLLVDWRTGEEWFWDTLCDADPANNTASWQWVAGSGADAAPYFRIFNPILQGEMFDGDGRYVRKYVPEIAALPDKYIHKPWEADGNTLEEAGITLGETYPRPMVDHARARERALKAYDKTKK